MLPEIRAKQMLLGRQDIDLPFWRRRWSEKGTAQYFNGSHLYGHRIQRMEGDILLTALKATCRL